MKESEKIELMNWLAQEREHAETIFLHLQQGKWVAYGHSALLLPDHAPGTKVKTIFCDAQRVPRAEWRGSMCFGVGAPDPRAGEFHISMPSPNLMVIRQKERTEGCSMETALLQHYNAALQHWAE